MIHISDISIKNKLVAMQVFTAVVVMGITILSFVISDISGYIQRKERNMKELSQITGFHSISAIVFREQSSARRILANLALVSDIDNAAILNKDGKTFASYTREEVPEFEFTLPEEEENKTEFTEDHLFVFTDIININEKIGTVAFRINLQELNELKKKKTIITVSMLIVGIALAFILAIIVQRNISKPLLDLVSTMNKVKEKGDYNIRAEIRGKDEINTLSKVFNNMLVQIRKREFRLKKRTEELEIVNQELESFASYVSHDLRTPIRVINGYTRVFEKKYFQKLDERGRELLGDIIAETVRMGQLIDDLLAFSRLGRKEVEKSQVDMTAMANQVIKDISGLKEEKNAKTKIIVQKLPDAYCDSILMRQVFINLISNAIKYSAPKPEPLIEIGAYPEANSTVYFVKDNGTGFDMKYTDKLFGVFQRLHGEEFEGTGIGLAIVKRIVTRHGGRVWAEGKPDQGAVFYFSLPK